MLMCIVWSCAFIFFGCSLLYMCQKIVNFAVLVWYSKYQMAKFVMST